MKIVHFGLLSPNLGGKFETVKKYRDKLSKSQE